MQERGLYHEEIIVAALYILLPIALGLIHGWIRGRDFLKYLFLYTLFISAGIQGLATGIVQMFFPEAVVKFTEWPASPFILELGMANFSFGVLAICALWLSRGWQFAAAVGYGLFLFLTGMGHVIDFFLNGANLGNAGGFLWSDLLGALSLFLFALLYHKQHPSVALQ